MTNFEKYKDEILGIIESNDGSPAAVNGRLMTCDEVASCGDCDFSGNGISCVALFVEWLCEEAKPDNKPEEPLEGIRSCEDCIYEDRSENEKPCIECKERYLLKFEPKPKEPKLKTCPFCGGKAKVRSEDRKKGKAYWAYCAEPIETGCDVRPVTCKFDTKEEAIEAWNRRADK